jgi:hypothetical protein
MSGKWVPDCLGISDSGKQRSSIVRLSSNEQRIISTTGIQKQFNVWVENEDLEAKKSHLPHNTLEKAQSFDAEKEAYLH